MEYGKRKPALKRKPSIVIAIGAPKAAKPDAEPEAESPEDGLTCPKCGMELADTPENRKYAAAREEEVADDDEMEEED
jgi:hypothetical protein